jgi:hypothetical protein
MVASYRSADWRRYRMDWQGDPHPVMEPLEREIEAVEGTLEFLRARAIIPHTCYPHERFLVYRKAVRKNFDIPWAGTSPRMQRLVYALNAIRQPALMAVVGIFCGDTFFINAGAAVGPGACCRARRLVGIEIDSAEASRACRNVALLDPDGRCEIVAADGSSWLESCADPIDLLYIEADGSYYPVIRAATRALRRGSLVLAYNSINLARSMRDYLWFVRSPQYARVSVNVSIDDQGLEVTLWEPKSSP